MNAHEIDTLACVLDDATVRSYEVERLTLKKPDLDLASAYLVQDRGISIREARGEKRIGFKMGLTSAAKRQQMSLDSPIYGILMDRMNVANGSEFSLRGMIHPKIEPEIAFKMGKSLSGLVSMEDVLGAVESVCGALEILDSRYKDFKYFSLPDVVADNCSSGYFVLGEAVPLDAVANLKNFEMKMCLNGQVAEQAIASEISGNPLNSVLQLCELLTQRNLSLPAGSWILAGAATRAIPLKAGDRISLHVGFLPETSVQVVS